MVCLTDLLRDRELWSSIIQVVDLHRGQNYEDVESLSRRADVDRHAFEDDRIWKLFQTRVIDRLSKPAPITAYDLVQNARQQFSGIPFVSGHADLHAAMQRFLAMSVMDAADESDIEQYGDRQIDLGRWVAETETTPDTLIRCEPLWESDSFYLDAVGRPSHLEAAAYEYELLGKVSGYCSAGALEAAEEWLEKYVTSIATTVARCATNQERAQTKYAEFVDSLNFLIDADTGRGIPPKYPAPLSFITHKDGVGNFIFAECLNAVGRIHLQETDSFTRRLANSVILLLEADRTDSTAVAFTLCFAAIEAMLCEDPNKIKAISLPEGDKNTRTDTTVQIKKYVTTVLMPKPVGRGKRGDVLYDLYCTRCNTIHGKSVTAPRVALHDVRQIAAGVLRSVIYWRKARLGRGETGDWEELFDQVNRAAFNKSEMADVCELSDLLPGERRLKQYQ